MRVNIGFNLVYGPRGVSFRILRSTPQHTTPEVIKRMDCPMWFRNKHHAKGCAKALIAKVREQLRKTGVAVEAYET